MGTGQGGITNERIRCIAFRSAVTPCEIYPNFHRNILAWSVGTFRVCQRILALVMQGDFVEERITAYAQGFIGFSMESMMKNELFLLIVSSTEKRLIDNER